MSASRRQRVARLLAATGIIRTLERGFLRPGLLVCNYHRVASPGNQPFDDATISASPDRFREQVSCLREIFETPSIDEITDRIERRCAFDRPTVLFTFDDGYRDNYENALPILRALGVPAAFFVVSDFVERPRLPWWDRVAYVLKRTATRRLQIAYPAELLVDLDQTPLATATRRVLRLFKDCGAVDEIRFFDDLERRAGVEVNSEGLARRMFMTWSELSEMNRAGMRIGSHTHTHRVLAPLSLSEQRLELGQSRSAIGDALRQNVDLL